MIWGSKCSGSSSSDASRIPYEGFGPPLSGEGTAHSQAVKQNLNTRRRLVQQKGKELIIRKQWQTVKLLSEQDTRLPIRFSLEGVTYTVYLSEKIENTLKGEGTLSKLRSALTRPTRLVRGRMVWGLANKDKSYLFYTKYSSVPSAGPGLRLKALSGFSHPRAGPAMMQLRRGRICKHFWDLFWIW